MKIEPSSVCTVILAYGSRTEPLRKVLSKVLELKSGLIIIVCNDLIDETRSLLFNLSLKNPDRIELVTSGINLGSSGGYALGISTAIKRNFDFIWLLDDDNLPKDNALVDLLQAYARHQQNISKEDLALQSFRESLPEFMDIFHHKSLPKLPRPASFIGFNIFNLFDSFVLKTLSDIPKIFHSLTDDVITLKSSPYGGLFFHRAAINKIGLPDTRLFLYADDFAYTYNFTLNGGTIHLVPNSRIIDLEPVWNASGGKVSNIYRRLKVLSSMKVYYEVRNRVYIGRTMFPGNKVVYLTNKWIYITILVFLGIYHRRTDRLKLILSAIRDGEHGHLGKRDFYNESS